MPKFPGDKRKKRLRQYRHREARRYAAESDASGHGYMMVSPLSKWFRRALASRTALVRSVPEYQWFEQQKDEAG